MTDAFSGFESTTLFGSFTFWPGWRDLFPVHSYCREKAVISGGLKMRRWLSLLLLAGVSLVNAKTFNVTLFENSTVGGTQLKPGTYKLEVMDQKVIIRNDKQAGEAPIKIENSDTKYSSTTVRYRTDDGRNNIQEIRLGGTKMKIVFN
jgi:hypothetical protein